MRVLTKPTEKLTGTGAPDKVRLSGEWLWVGLVVGLFAGSIGLWHWFDHKWPAPDDSSFILASFQYADLLGHPKFWKLDWWYSMLTVNRAYPPTVMIFNGMLRLLFGGGNWVNALSVASFSCVFTATIYGVTRLVSRDPRAGLFAALLVNLYPQTSCMSHGFALDFPLVSMISFGLFSLLWWRSAPGWGRALICGLSMGAACLTKQIAAVYLIGPGVFCLVEAIRQDMRARRWNLSRQLAGAAAVTALVGLPWLLTNLSFIRNWAHDNASHMGPISLWEVFPRDIAWYAESLPSIMSPVLFAAFLLALPIVGKSGHRLLAPIGLSAVGGVILVSTLTWAFPSLRYVAPAMIAMAVYTGFAMSRLLDQRLKAMAVWAVIFLGAVQYFSFNFAPYPFSKPAFLSQAAEKLGVNVVEKWGLTQRDQRGFEIQHSNPQPPADWGQEWALRTIDAVEGRKPVYLNILPDYVQLNGNTFELVARTLGSPVRPTTSRRWTIMGDCVKFDPATALYFQWYLLKSGHQGNLLRDDESEKNYAKLVDFVEHAGKFTLIGTHELPDGSTISLYRPR